MNRRFTRFSLASLLAVFAFAAICLAYARWHRERTIAEYATWHAEGVGLIMATGEAPWWAGSWLNEEFWLRRPITAEIYVAPAGTNFDVGHRRLSWPEAQEYLKSMEVRLVRLGVPNIEVWHASMNAREVEGLLSKSRGRWVAPGELVAFINKLGMTPRRAFGASDLQMRYEAARP